MSNSCFFIMLFAYKIYLSTKKRTLFVQKINKLTNIHTFSDLLNHVETRLSKHFGIFF